MVRLLATAFAVSTGLCLTPQVSQAEFIFTTGQHAIDSQQSGEFAPNLTSELVPGMALATPEPEKPEPAAPETPPLAIAEVELDGLQDASTSGPVTEATGSGSSTLAVLGTADLRLSRSAAARLHSLIEDLAPESPLPGELLDPPRA